MDKVVHILILLEIFSPTEQHSKGLLYRLDQLKEDYSPKFYENSNNYNARFYKRNDNKEKQVARSDLKTLLREEVDRLCRESGRCDCTSDRCKDLLNQNDDNVEEYLKILLKNFKEKIRDKDGKEINGGESGVRNGQGDNYDLASVGGSDRMCKKSRYCGCTGYRCGESYRNEGSSETDIENLILTLIAEQETQEQNDTRDPGSKFRAKLRNHKFNRDVDRLDDENRMCEGTGRCGCTGYMCEEPSNREGFKPDDVLQIPLDSNNKVKDSTNNDLNVFLVDTSSLSDILRGKNVKGKKQKVEDKNTKLSFFSAVWRGIAAAVRGSRKIAKVVSKPKPKPSAIKPKPPAKPPAKPKTPKKVKKSKKKSKNKKKKKKKKKKKCKEYESYEVSVEVEYSIEKPEEDKTQENNENTKVDKTSSSNEKDNNSTDSSDSKDEGEQEDKDEKLLLNNKRLPDKTLADINKKTFIQDYAEFLKKSKDELKIGAKLIEEKLKKMYKNKKNSS